MARLIIFTDLDGTLLDHETYDYSPAQDALRQIKSLEIPLIFATSKTAAEIQALFPEEYLRWPAIVENGAGIWRPDNATIATTPTTDTLDYDAILQCLDALPEHLRTPFIGFFDMSVDDIAELTGLSRKSASLAKARDYSEPGLWRGTDEDFAEFKTKLKADGLTVITGGRFIHILAKTTKARQMAVLKREFQAYYERELVATVALGDAPNDIEMLEAADYGFIIPNPSGSPLPKLEAEASGKIRRAAFPGPKGWNSALTELFAELALTEQV